MHPSALRRAAAGLAFAASIGVTSQGFGQTSQGILAGVTRDVSGAAVPNATLTATNQGTGETRTIHSGPDGGYRIEAITPGRYTIVTTDAGFSTSQVKNIAVQPSVVTSYDVVLQVGTASTEVTVEANQATVDTDNGVLSGIVSSTELDKLPIFSLNPVELATTVPGVQPVQGGNGAFSNGINIQVNGARPRANNYLMDGQEINDVGIGGQAFQPAIPDIFESVTVITNSASAEYGRGGGGILNLVTKSGTNQFHGTLFERYNGSGLNSVPGPFRGSGFVNARYDQHSFGFTAGGPILKDKLFVFGGSEWQRYYGQETPNVNLLPDAAGYAQLQTLTGTAATQVALLDQYLSNGAYLTQDIPPYASTGSPINANVGPQPGCPTSGCTISFAGFQRPNAPETSTDTQWMYRVDYKPREKDTVAFRYLHDRTFFTPDFLNNPNALAGFDTNNGGPSELAGGTWTHIFGPRLLNEFRLSEARLAFTFSPTAQTAANPLNSLPTIEFTGIQGNTTAGTEFFFNGGASTGNSTGLGPNQNFPQGRKEDLYQFQDTLRYSLGRQSLSIGADIGRLIEIDLVSQNALGTLSFNGGGTGVTSLGNFLFNQLGPSGTATKTFGPTRADSHGWRNGIFAQDDIKLNADLTVNLGVRYDYLSNPENSLIYPGIDPSNVFAPINTVVPVQKDWNNIAPRLGFAYSPHGVLGFLGDGKTSVRGGFGVFYDSTFSNILVNSAQSAPNAVADIAESTQGNGLANATSIIPSLSPSLSATSSVESEASNLVNPLTYQYNLGVERQVPGGIVLGVRYVGNRGEKLFANQQYNYFNGLTGKRLNPARNFIVLRGNYADSEYNGLEITGSHNFRHGLLINANYNYSKDLDDGSEIFTISGSTPTSYSANLAPGGRRQDWGPSAYDHRQFFSVAYVYQLPGVHSSNRLVDLAENILTRNWTISGVTQLQSGGYSSYNTYGYDLNGDGNATNDRPIVVNRAASLQSVGVDGYFVGGTPGVYYDVATLNGPSGALVPVSAGSVHFLAPYFPDNSFLHQEIGRNSYMQPGTTLHNVALEKGFSFKERGALILRAEAQNLPNHNDATVGDLSVFDAGTSFLTASHATINPNTFGYTSRSLVLWAKFEF